MPGMRELQEEAYRQITASDCLEGGLLETGSQPAA
jgi:hypothetical protein